MKIYAIEITSQCNLSCTYCPQPTMKRKKEHMDIDVFSKILNYPIWYNILPAHFFGEALLHPDLNKIANLADERGLAFGFSTNMLEFDLDRFHELRNNGLKWLKISYHIPEAEEWYKYLTANYPDFLIIASELKVKHDWAGQVDKNKKANIKENVENSQPDQIDDCIFHKFDLVQISAQGEIYACCMDSEGLSSQGSIFDYTVEEFSEMKNNIYFELCKKCPMVMSEELLQAQEDEYKVYTRTLNGT